MTNNTTVKESFGRVSDHQSTIMAGDAKVAPGEPQNFSDACTFGDALWQGDLRLTIAKEIPSEYTARTEKTGKLVPGNTQGSRHAIENLDAVEIFDPPGWNFTDYDGIAGPFLRVKKSVEVVHPTHGNIGLRAGDIIGCDFQVDVDQQEKRLRRQMD